MCARDDLSSPLHKCSDMGQYVPQNQIPCLFSKWISVSTLKHRYWYLAVLCCDTRSHKSSSWRPSLSPSFTPLHPGVRRAGELARPVWRPPCGGVEVDIVGVGFEWEGLSVGRGRTEAKWLVIQWRRRQVVHSVAVVIFPLRLVVERLCMLAETGGGQLGR